LRCRVKVAVLPDELCPSTGRATLIHRSVMSVFGSSLVRSSSCGPLNGLNIQRTFWEPAYEQVSLRYRSMLSVLVLVLVHITVSLLLLCQPSVSLPSSISCSAYSRPRYPLRRYCLLLPPGSAECLGERAWYPGSLKMSPGPNHQANLILGGQRELMYLLAFAVTHPFLFAYAVITSIAVNCALY
jgi:hypothetical protein